MSLNDVFSAIDSEIARIEQARNLLAEFGASKRGRKPATKQVKAQRTFSPATRKRMAEAQRKRWAAHKKAAK